MSRSTPLGCTLVTLVLTTPIIADTIQVPDPDHGILTIQDGIDAAVPGDTVIVADGVWAGRGNVNLTFDGKAITVRSENGPDRCIIDCGDTDRGFVFNHMEGPGSTLSRFTISNGAADEGGAILVDAASPTILGCVITGCTATRGAGIFVRLGDPLIRLCTIVFNCAANSGGGIYVDSLSQTNITECVIKDNFAVFGGGVTVFDADATFTDCTIDDNFAEAGGGIFISAGGDTAIDGGSISNNSASTSVGGGVAISAQTDGQTTIDGVTFDGNHAGTDGGGVFSSNSQLILSCNEFVDNTATRGGGTFIEGCAGQDFAPICSMSYDNLYSGNHANFGAGCMYRLGGHALQNGWFSFNAAAVFGGAILNESADLDATDLWCSDNSAMMAGGTFAASSGGSFRLKSSYIGHSWALDGGAGFLLDHDATGPGVGSSIVNCTFACNMAGRWGGALYHASSDLPLSGCLFTVNTAQRGGAIYNSASSPALTNCTFSVNIASDDGGGLFNTAGSQPNIGNCILWDDVPNAIVNTSGAPTISYSNVQGGVPAAWDAGGNVEADPLFVAPSRNDWRLQTRSTCIDAGRNDTVPASLVTDLNGFARFADVAGSPDCPQSPGTCGTAPVVDMGAYEVQAGCASDLDGNGLVDFGDLLTVLSAWNTSGPADIDGSGLVDFGDLLAVLSAWGPCP